MDPVLRNVCKTAPKCRNWNGGEFLFVTVGFVNCMLYIKRVNAGIHTCDQIRAETTEAEGASNKFAYIFPRQSIHLWSSCQGESPDVSNHLDLEDRNRVMEECSVCVAVKIRPLVQSESDQGCKLSLSVTPGLPQVTPIHIHMHPAHIGRVFFQTRASGRLSPPLL